MNLGVPELLFILVAALVFLGPRRLPEIGGQVGRAMAQFKQAKEGFVSEIMAETSPPVAAPTPPPIGMESTEDVGVAVKAAMDEHTGSNGDTGQSHRAFRNVTSLPPQQAERKALDRSKRSNSRLGAWWQPRAIEFSVRGAKDLAQRSRR